MRLIAALFAVIAFAARAEGPRTYAIVSLLGDQLAVVAPGSTTGTSVDHSTHGYLKLDSPALDKAALLAADTALRGADVAATSALLLVRDPAIYQAQDKSLEDGAAVASLVPMLAGTLRSVHATHLLLLTKMRHDASFETARSHVGQGRLEGLGFYVDRATRVDDESERTEYVGFLGPYAYFRISLIDLDGPRVVAQKDVVASQTRIAKSSVHPWEELDAQQKVSALESMLGTKIAEGVPQVLKSAR